MTNRYFRCPETSPMDSRLAWLAAAGLMLAATVHAAALPAGWLAKVDASLIAAAQSQGQAEFLVAMNSRADLAMAEATNGREAKSSIVIQILKAHAASSQAGVLQELAARGLAHRSFWIANTVSATGDWAVIEALAQRADVAHIYLVKPEIVDLPGGTAGGHRAGGIDRVDGYDANGVEQGNARIRAPEVWALGYTGQGVVVGDHDIGVDWTHPALKPKYRGWNGTTASHDFNWRNAFSPDVLCPEPDIPCDPNGHGTHTTGTMVGDGGPTRRIGMAPDAKWIACRSLYDDVAGLGTVPAYLDCMEWMMAPYPIDDPDNADPAMAPDVVNNSWGCVEACAPPVLKDVNDATKAAGIVQVVSAGNDGSQCSTIAFPLAVYESSFTVGASNTLNDGMASFSSRGPVTSDGSMRIKPNVVAPGVGTCSSVPGGGYDCGFSGTSMAGPHVAGLIALVMSAEPRLIGRVDDVRRLVELTANPAVASTQACGGIAATTIPNNVFGYGRVDALAAVLARPQLTAAVAAPASAAFDSTFAVGVTVSQPAAGKIGVTGSDLTVNLATGLQYLSATETPASSSTGAGGTTLHFARAAALAPGASWTVTLQVKAIGDGSQAVTTATEADQVSPRDGGSDVVDITSSFVPFTFIERTGVATSVFITSESKTMAGFGGTLLVSVSLGGQYRINSGAFTTATGNIAAGDKLTVRHVSSSDANTPTETTVTVGSYPTIFRSVTSNLDRTPASFTFGTQAGVTGGDWIESILVTVDGYNTGIPIVAGPGIQYSKNNGTYTNASGTLQPGDTLRVQHQASGKHLEYTKTYLKVGGVVGYFTTRTR